MNDEEERINPGRNELNTKRIDRVEWETRAMRDIFCESGEHVYNAITTSTMGFLINCCNNLHAYVLFPANDIIWLIRFSYLQCWEL